MTGKLIISFDCEGKWGIADRGAAKQMPLTSKALETAYQNVSELLAEFDISATFAFVAALCMERPGLRRDIENKYDAVMYKGSHWLAAARDDLAAGRPEGWCEPSLLDIVARSGMHHLCSHGGFHVPYERAHVSEGTIAGDIDAIHQITSRIGSAPDVFIFPRNKIGFTKQLALAGIRGYRDVDPRELAEGLASRALRVLFELYPLDAQDFTIKARGEEDVPFALTPGKFLNSGRGLRARIPLHFTKKRIDRFLTVATESNSIVHIYSHPENAVVDPALVDKLRYLLQKASGLRDQGRLEIITMKDELNGRESRVLR